MTITVSSGATVTVSSGVTSSGLTIEGLLTVDSGGALESGTVSNGGRVVISSGASVGHLLIDSGGLAYNNLGLISDVTVSNGGTLADNVAVGSGQDVGYGATPTGVTVLSGGILQVAGATVLSGGTVTLSSGTTGADVTVSAGGKLVGPGEIAYGDIYGLMSDVVVGENTLAGNAEAFVQSGGRATRVVVENGVLEVVAGGTTSLTQVTSITEGPATEDVYGLSISAVVRGSGSLEEVESGGVSESATISNGGSAVILPGGVASALVIDSGGWAYVQGGAVVSGVTISSGAKLIEGLVVSSGENLGYGATPPGVTLLSGGVLDITGATVLRGGTLTLSSGSILANTTVSAGGKLIGPGEIGGPGVSAHIYGSISDVVVGDAVDNDSADVYLVSGAVAHGVVIHNGNLLVSSGATASKTLVTFDVAGYGFSTEDVSGLSVSAVVRGSGAVQFVESGGISENATISKGGSAGIQSGGLASGLVVDSGGSAFIVAGGLISGATVSSGGVVVDQLVVSSGQDAGYVLSGATVLAGGVADFVGVTVMSGGTLTLASGTIVSATSDLTGYSDVGVTVYAGGTLVGPGEIADDSYDYISGSISGVVLGDAVSGYSEAGLASGAVARWVVLRNGELYVSAGATAYHTLVTFDGGDLGGSVEYVAGLSVSAVVRGSGADEIVEQFGISEDATISRGGTEYLDDNATGEALTVLAGGTVDGYGVLIGVNAIYGSANSVEVGGGSETIYSGGVTDQTTVLSGGAEFISAAGRAIEVTVSSGGVEYVLASGTTTGTLVFGGGTERVSSGGVASGTTAISGGRQYISSGGSAVDATVSSGGVEYVLASGTTTGTAVNYGGYELVSAGGVASETEVLIGGRLYISSGGGAVSTTVSSGGDEYVWASGTATGTVVSDGGHQVVSSGGVADETTVLWSGRQYISSGGRAVDTTVSSGGVDYVLALGTTTGTVVSAGGYEIVSSGGVASDATVLSGGKQYLSSGAATEATVVSAGGNETIFSGGVAYGLSVLSGGVLIDDGEARIAGAGTLDGLLSGSGAIVQSGAGDLVIGGSGAAFSGKAAIEGGTIELASAGALGAGTVEFVEPSTGSAVLQIDAADAPAAGETFANTIVDFSGANEDIDLRSIAFVSGATASVTGDKLVLTDGGKTYTFDIGGSIAAAYPVLSDGHGGTLIDPKVVAFTHAAAAFAAPAAAATAPISRTSSSAETPFLHATGSAGAGHL